MTDSIFDVALEKRFSDSSEIATIDVTSADTLLIRDSTTGVIMRLPFSTLASAISTAFASSFASLVDGKVPASQLPSYVDDVLEYANTGAFPATGETGKIYVALDTNKTYRWSGSGYIEISASPGSTDAVPEGATNLYFTNARASAAAPVQSVAGKTGTVSLAKSDVGLSNVDNTSDLTKNSAVATLSNKTFGDNPTFSNGVANAIPFLNGSKIISWTTSLTYDGTSFSISGKNLSVSGSNGNGTALSTDANSNVFVPRAYSVAVTDGVALYAQSDGRIGPQPSSEKYKTKIKSIDESLNWFNKLRPVSYFYKNKKGNAKGQLEYGLIAEEVAKLDKNLIHFIKGEISTVHYNKLIAVLIYEVQKIKKLLNVN